MPQPEPLLLARRRNGRVQTLSEHCGAVAAYASRTGEALGLPSLMRLCGLLHDFGKASDAFQAYLLSDEPAEKGSVPHAPQGAVFVRRRWHRQDAPTADLIAVAVAAHHGRLPDLVDEHGAVYTQETLACERFDDLAALEARFAAQVAALPVLDSLFALACAEVKRMGAVLAESVGDLRGASPQAAGGPAEPTTALHFLLGLMQRGIHSALIDADRWDAYRFEAELPPDVPIDPPWASWAAALEKTLCAFPRETEIDRRRAALSEECLSHAGAGAGVYRLCVPTGGGKTFASLRFALASAQKAGMARIVYAAPYKTILEQTADVFRRALGREELILEHHSDVALDEEGEAAARHQLLTQRWDAPLVLTTAVQLLDTLFAGRGAAVRRFAALGRSLIILDEVQCIPMRCWYLLTLAIRYLTRAMGCAVVLCTATQPMWEALPVFPLPPPVALVRDEGALFEAFRRVRVTDLLSEGPLPPERIARDLLDALPAAGSALCILNTKKTAAALYAALRSLLPTGLPLYCLTTRQCPAHRVALLMEIRALLKAGKPVVCVATQLIEAGVDVSFGLTVRALAGLESVAQAAGRCNRNAERPFGELRLVRIEGEQLGSLREIERAQGHTLAVRSQLSALPADARPDLLSPVATRAYFLRSIRENGPEMRYPDRDRPGSPTLLDLLACNERGRAAYQDHHGGQPCPALFAQAFRQAGDAFCALDAPTTAVLVPWSEGARRMEEIAAARDPRALPSLLRRAQRYTVAVYRQELQALLDSHALRELGVSGLYGLDAAAYDEALGLRAESRGLPVWIS